MFGKNLRIVLILIVIFIIQQSYAGSFKVDLKRELRINKGYIGSLNQTKTQAIGISYDNKKLFSIFRLGESYFLDISDLSDPRKNQYSYFLSQSSIDSKILRLIVGRKKRYLLIFSKHSVMTYDIKSKIFVNKEKISQTIIDAKIINDNSQRIYILASKVNKKGILLGYKINANGSLQEIAKENLTFKALKFKIYDRDHLYIQSEKNVYQYNLKQDGSISASHVLITDKPVVGYLDDFDISKESGANSYLVVAIREVDSQRNTESGDVRFYHIGQVSNRSLLSIHTIDVPKRVLINFDKNTGDKKAIIVYDHRYQVLDPNTGEVIVKGAIGNSMDLIKKDSWALLASDGGNKNGIGDIQFFNLTTGTLIEKYSIIGVPEFVDFSPFKFFAVSTQTGIDVFRIF